MGYVKRVRSTGLDTKGKNNTILPILLAASMSVGPTWERARLLVDSGSEHPPLIHQSLADLMGLRGPVAGGATQANSDYLPLYDVGQLHLGLHNLTKQERHQIGQHRILIPWIRYTPLSARPFTSV